MKNQAAYGRICGTVCDLPAAVALGQQAVLKGSKTTCYLSFMEQLAPSATAAE